MNIFNLIAPIIDDTVSSGFFDIPFWSGIDMLEMVVRFAQNLFFVFVLVKFLYLKYENNTYYAFTYIALSVVIFMICFLLNTVKLELGFALGLFAIFGILRYRTDAIPIKEMTYLFVVIGITVINSLSNKLISHSELLGANLLILWIIWILEHNKLLKSEKRKVILYEKIQLIKPENQALMLEDLKQRTGLNITRYEVGSINLLRDTAEVIIFY